MFSAASKTAAAVSAAANYIEDVFSTYLYTGTSATQTITNGIDLAGKGGLIWTKSRSDGTQHQLCDTARGINKFLRSDVTNGEYTASSNTLTSFNSNGYSMGADSNGNINYTGINYASWTFREQPKFFDVVTWTGNGTGSRAISHSLASTPGCIILKRTDAADDWYVVHRSASSFSGYAVLNTTAAFTTMGSGISSVGSTSFTVSSYYNGSGATWVAYVFAHDAGGFGLTGTDNVISCGSLSGAGTTVNLGWEPQWILAKRTDTTGNWYIDDNMRGWPAAPGNDNPLLANTSGAEPTGYAGFANITSTGFTNNFNGDYIYIAIRRGPMKTPTTGTSVFSPVSQTGGGTVTTNFVVDGVISKQADNALAKPTWFDRLRGSSATSSAQLFSSDTSAETDPGVGLNLANNTGYVDSAFGAVAGRIYWNFRRAPGFFDVVCYTGTGVARTVSHNLGVVPELMIVKRRSTTNAWAVYANNDNTDYLVLNTDAATVDDNTYWNDTTPTASVFSIGTNNAVNASGSTYVAYLFATVAGVSKVGSYTGSGTTKQIDCGFTGGARFVLIKRTDSTGDWYVWDSARGIVSGNDPYLLLNSTAAEVTNTDYVDTYSAGFEISSTAPAAINANGGTFIFLAIA